MTGLHLRVLTNATAEFFRKLGVLAFDVHGDEHLDGITERSLVQVDGKVFDDAAFHERLHSPLHRTRRQVHARAELGPGDAAVLLQR